MEAKSNADTVTTLSVKDLPDMDCSCDKYSAYDCNSMSQPPPKPVFQAYTKPKIPSSAVKIAKIVAITFLLSCLILGFFVVATTYVQTLAKCNCDKTDGVQTASVVEVIPPQARIQAPLNQKSVENLLKENQDKTEKPPRRERKKPKSTTTTTTTTTSTAPPTTSEVSFFPLLEELSHPSLEDFIAEKLLIPLSFNLDEIAGQLLDNNQRANMNCVVEKHRDTNIPEEFLRNLPFNQTGAGFVHVIGERMVMNCDGGQKNPPMIRRQPMFPLGPMQRPFPIHMMPPNLPQGRILPAPFLVPPSPNTHFTREARSHNFEARNANPHVIFPRSTDSQAAREKRCSCACK